MNSTRAFRVAATGARVVTGVVVAAGCVVGVVAAVAAPWPVMEQAPAAVEVAPVPGDTELVCAGDFRAIGRDPAEPQKMVSAGTPHRTVDGSTDDVRTEELTTSGLDSAGKLPLLVGEVEARKAPLLGAAESLTVSADDLAGFAAAPCREPRAESWLVGGSAATGAEDIVTLTNPGAVAATVTLTVFGDDVTSSEVVVPARTQTALPLTSIAPDSPTPVVKVSAAGAPVRAMLQSALTRTLDPSGIDLQDAVAGPQQHPVIAGVRVFADGGLDTDMAVLRMLSTDVDAQATVTVRAVGSSSAPMQFDVPLTADVPSEVALGDVAPGQYVVEIDADAPILSAVRQQDGAGRGYDFAWVAPAPEIDGETTVAVPAGPEPRLNLVAVDAEATVTLQPIAGGDPKTLTIPAGGSATVAVDQRTVYSLSSTAPVHAAVDMTTGGALAAWPVWPSAGAEQTVTVYP